MTSQRFEYWTIRMQSLYLRGKTRSEQRCLEGRGDSQRSEDKRQPLHCKMFAVKLGKHIKGVRASV